MVVCQLISITDNLSIGREGNVMRMKLLALAFSLGSTQIASAEDPSISMEEAPASFNWTGSYVGAQVGFASGDSEAFVVDDTAWTTDMSPDGFFGGAFAGYNHQLDSGFILGAEADVNLASIRFDGVWTGLDGLPIPDEVTSTRVNWTAALRGRVAYTFDRVLLFIAGGVAFADVRIDDTAYGDRRPSLDKTLTGWTLGGGVDYAISDSLFGRVEYRYSDFGTEPNSHSYDDWLPYAVDFKTHDVRLGIAYKF